MGQHTKGTTNNMMQIIEDHIYNMSLEEQRDIYQAIAVASSQCAVAIQTDIDGTAGQNKETGK